MDCCLIPFVRSKLTKSIYPLKLNEYLAAGKPVVSTSFSSDLNDFKELIKIAGDKKKFLEYVKLEITEDNESKKSDRINIAKSNTWESR